MDLQSKKKSRKTPSALIRSLLPLSIANLHVHKLTWNDFQGLPDQHQPWSAHTFWKINYTYEDGQQLRPNINVVVCSKSWVRQNRKCFHLLNHEQGHYLIGCLCALQFLRRLHREEYLSEGQVSELFYRTLKEFLQLQIRYDKETNHRLNFIKQELWDEMLLSKLIYYKKIFNPDIGIFETIRKKA